MDDYECCASGSCEVCRRPSGYSSEYRDRMNRDRDEWISRRIEEERRGRD